MLMGKKNKTGAGRPTDYDYEYYHKLVLEYLKECVDVVTEFHKTRGEKSDSFDRLIQVKLPSIEGLCLKLDIAKDTLYAWKEKYEEFFKVKVDLSYHLVITGDFEHHDYCKYHDIHPVKKEDEYDEVDDEEDEYDETDSIS